MSKTYILEPIEIVLELGQFDLAPSAIINSESEEYEKILNATESLTIGDTLLLSDTEFKYAGMPDDTIYVFTEDGTMSEEPDPDLLFVAINTAIGPTDIQISTASNMQAGTYTLSIYNGEDDPEPEPTPSSSLTPITREEMYLSAIAGLTELPSDMKPITREEIFLDAILNGNGGSVTPITRKEMFLDAIANKE